MSTLAAPDATTSVLRRPGVSTAVGLAAERRALAARGRNTDLSQARTAARQLALASRRDTSS